MGIQVQHAFEPDLFRQLEEAGATALWVGGHVSSPYTTPEVIVRLAGLVEQTERVLLGTGVLLLPLYPPGLIAKQLADIDRASQGRLIVGVGVGGEQEGDFRACGVPVEERGSRTDESIPLLRKFWTAEPVQHEGKHFHYDNVTIQPAPTQPGGPPLIVSGRSGPARRRAALLGDGWMPHLYSVRQYRESVDEIKSLAAEAGRDLSTFSWVAFLAVSMDDDPVAARRAALEGFGRSYGQDVEQMLDKIAVVGTPEQVLAKMQDYVDAGARHLVVSAQQGRQLLDELLPELRVPRVS